MIGVGLGHGIGARTSDVRLWHADGRPYRWLCSDPGTLTTAEAHAVMQEHLGGECVGRTPCRIRATAIRVLSQAPHNHLGVFKGERQMVLNRHPRAWDNLRLPETHTAPEIRW